MVEALGISYACVSRLALSINTYTRSFPHIAGHEHGMFMLHHAGEKEFTMARIVNTNDVGLPCIELYAARQFIVAWLAMLQPKHNTGVLPNDRRAMRDFAIVDTLSCFMDGDDGSEFGVIHGRVSRESIGHSLKTYGRGSHGPDHVLMEIKPYMEEGYTPILLTGVHPDVVDKLTHIHVV